MSITATKEVRTNAEVALTGSIPASTISTFYERAVIAAVKEVALPGFRKGHVPRERVIEEVGESFLWKDAAERALRDELENLLSSHDLSPIVPLTFSLSTVEMKQDVPFEIVVTVAPTCEPLDYKGIAKKALAGLPQEDASEEHTQAVRAFRTQVRAIIKMQKPEEVKEGDASDNEAKADTPLSDDESKHVGFENADAAEFFIKGEAEKAVADRFEQKKRSALAEALIAEASCQIPRILVDEEVRGMRETFKKDVVAQGMPWTDYLARVQKTEAQVEDDLRPNAVKRITLDLVFGTIVREEKLELGEEDTKKEEAFAHSLVERGVDHQRAHQAARESLIREKVWELLGAASPTAVS